MDLIERTIALAMENVERGGRPFSCVVARADDDRVVAESPNLVQQTNDPTAHAEILAVRQACQRLASPSLEGHEVYVLAHPCLGALYYASPDNVIFVVTREEEGRHYHDDQKYFEFENFYDEYAKPWPERRLPMEHRPNEGGVEVYRRWRELNP